MKKQTIKRLRVINDIKKYLRHKYENTKDPEVKRVIQDFLYFCDYQESLNSKVGFASINYDVNELKELDNIKARIVEFMNV